MPICSAVLTLAPDTGAARDLLDALGATPQITCGPAVPRGDGSGLPDRLAVLLDTVSLSEEQGLLRALEEHPGTGMIEVAFHDFSDALDLAEHAHHPRRGNRRLPEVLS
jgi:hypothetical protein